MVAAAGSDESPHILFARPGGPGCYTFTPEITNASFHQHLNVGANAYSFRDTHSNLYFYGLSSCHTHSRANTAPVFGSGSTRRATTHQQGRHTVCCSITRWERRLNREQHH